MSKGSDDLVCPNCYHRFGAPISVQQRAQWIDQQYAGKLALLLECMILDPRRWHDDAANILDQYRAEWDRLNPGPSPFGKD